MVFSQKEQACGYTFNNNGPFFHLCTPGKYTELLCETDEDYKFLVTLIAIAASCAGVTVITFAVMSNHLHVLLAGPEHACRAFFDLIKKKLKRYCSSKQRYVNLSGFECKLIPVESLRQIRIEIAYIHRNAYLASDRYLPFSYPWSAGYLFFNPMVRNKDGVPYNSLAQREKREVCRGRALELPEQFIIRDGMILPDSFCAVRFAEALFRDAHQYFSMISKNYEAYSEVAKALGDDVFLNDEEMFVVLQLQCRKQFGTESRPAMLPQKDKLALAGWMKQNYNASIGQMQRMLRLDKTALEEMFGL